MKKATILIVLAVLLVMIAPAVAFECNVTTEEGQIVIDVEMTSYELSPQSEPSIGVYLEPCTNKFNILIIPQNGTRSDRLGDNVVHCTTATASPPSYTFTKTISVDPGKYLILVLNSGRDYGSGFLYDGMGVEGDIFCLVLQNGIINKTQAEIFEIVWNATINAYGSDDTIYVYDPIVEAIEQPPTPTSAPTPTSTPIVTSTPTSTITPTPVVPTPVPTPTMTSIPPSTLTPGFEAVFAIIGLLEIGFLLLKRKK